MDWQKVAIHPDVSEAVDAILRGRPLATETRWLDESGEVKKEKEVPVTAIKETVQSQPPAKASHQHRLYLFGVNRGRFEQMSKEMPQAMALVDDLGSANLFVTSKTHYRRKPQKVREAEAANLPIYVLKSNTPNQIRHFLNTIYPIEGSTTRSDKADSFNVALSEAEEAVNLVQNGEPEVELSPQSSYVRRLQHLVAERNELSSQSTGREPERRVRIFK